MHGRSYPFARADQDVDPKEGRTSGVADRLCDSVRGALFQLRKLFRRHVAASVSLDQA
jgi:hypothetical protein